MDVLHDSTWMHTDTWSLLMPSWWTYCCTVTQFGCFTRDAQWEDLLMHSDFDNFIVNNGLLKLLLLLLSFKIVPTVMIVNRVGYKNMVNHLRLFLSESMEEGSFFYLPIHQCSDLLWWRGEEQVSYKTYLVINFQ